MSRIFTPLKFTSLVTTLALSGAVLLLSGCGMSGGGASIPGASTGGVSAANRQQGAVIGGQNPVKNGLIQLYQIGIGSGSSYTANAQPLISQTILTDANGFFDITGKYSCTPGTYLYLTASGGDPGLGSGVNPNITLMASVGLCDNLPSVPYIAVNEVTTVAMAYAFAQFGRTSLFGTALSSQSAGTLTPAINFATSSTNVQGVANAAAMANLLANPVDGTSPGYNGNGVWNSPLTISGLGNSGATGAIAEFWQVNTIADILGACVNSAGVAGSSDTTSNCAVLFNNVVPLAGTAAPADTAQAALALALTPNVPAANIANLYAKIPATAPFLPYVLPNAAAINDFSIAVQMKPTVPGTSTELIFEPSWIGTDSNGNIWVANSSAVTTHPASFLEIAPNGVPMPAGTASGNTAANYLINSYTKGGVVKPFTGDYQIKADGVTYVSINSGVQQGSIDPNNNVWASDFGSDAVMKISGSGGPGAGTTHNGGNAGDPGGNGALGYPLLAGSGPSLSMVDGNNNVWTSMSGYSQGLAGTAHPGACGTNYQYNVGTAGFLGGDPTNGSYSPTYVPGGVNYAFDPNLNDTVTPGGTTTPIPGAPFLWTNTAYVVNQQYTGGTTPGCATPLNSLAGSTTGNTTQLAGQTIATGDVAYPIGSNTFDLAFDSKGYLWIARPGTIDVATAPATTSVPYAIVKMLPSYGSAFTPAQAIANTTFTYFTGVAGMSTTYNARAISIDGDGNVWFVPNTGFGHAELNNSGVALSPSAASAYGPGFRGSICTGCKFRGSTTGETYQRSVNVKPGKPAFDISGNVWSVLGGTGAGAIEVIVGAAAPTVEPLSLGLKNKTLATRP